MEVAMMVMMTTMMIIAMMMMMMMRPSLGTKVGLLGFLNLVADERAMATPLVMTV